MKTSKKNHPISVAKTDATGKPIVKNKPTNDSMDESNEVLDEPEIVQSKTNATDAKKVSLDQLITIDARPMKKQDQKELDIIVNTMILIL